MVRARGASVRRKTAPKRRAESIRRADRPRQRRGVIAKGRDVRVVLSTAPSPEVAESIARKLLEARLAACVNLVSPVRSMYWWQGKLHTDNEVLLIIKTAGARVKKLLSRLRDVHSYDVPEGLVCSVETGLSAYLDWVLMETSGSYITMSSSISSSPPPCGRDPF